MSRPKMTTPPSVRSPPTIRMNEVSPPPLVLLAGASPRTDAPLVSSGATLAGEVLTPPAIGPSVPTVVGWVVRVGVEVGPGRLGVAVAPDWTGYGASCPGCPATGWTA